MLKNFKKLEEETTECIKAATSKLDLIKIRNSIKTTISDLDLFRIHTNIENTRTLVEKQINFIYKIKNDTKDPVVYFRASMYISSLEELGNLLKNQNIDFIKNKL